MGDLYHMLVADVMKVSGRHSMKFGMDVRFNYVNYAQLGQPNQRAVGGFNFARDMTQGPDPRVPSNVGGNGYASFLLGHRQRKRSLTRSGRRMPTATMAFMRRTISRCRAKLTLNVGLRWDFETRRYGAVRPHERHRSLRKNPLSKRSAWICAADYLFAGGQSGTPGDSGHELKKLNPRFGVAYQLNPKTVIRSGYGIFFGAAPYTANAGYTGGAFSSTTPWLGTLDGITPNDLLRNPFPNGFSLPRGSPMAC